MHSLFSLNTGTPTHSICSSTSLSSSAKPLLLTIFIFSISASVLFSVNLVACLNSISFVISLICSSLMVLNIALPKEVLYTGFLVPMVAVVIIGFSGSNFDIYTIFVPSNTPKKQVFFNSFDSSFSAGSIISDIFLLFV